MSEEAGETQNIEMIWESLSEEDRDFLSLISVSDWDSGVNDTLLTQSMGVPSVKIIEWVRNGLLQQGTGESFAKEWLLKNSDSLNAIRSKGHNLRSDREREIMKKAANFERIVTSRLQEITGAPRYRMASPALHDFAHSKLT